MVGDGLMLVAAITRPPKQRADPAGGGVVGVVQRVQSGASTGAVHESRSKPSWQIHW